MSNENEIAGTSAAGSDDRRCGKLFEALSKAQAEFKQVHKTNTNPYFKSKYAPLENIIEAVVPALSKYGLSVVQIPENDGGRATIKTVIGHSSGDQISGTMSMTPTKNDPQGMGSAYTYARRYSLAMMLNVAAEEDDDANAASVEQKKKPATSYPAEKKETKQASDNVESDLISDAQCKRFYAIAKGAGWNDDDLKAWLVENYKIDSTKKISRTIYEYICEKVQEDAPGNLGE